MTSAARTAPRRRFKPYPAYKDSGVDWLGEIPAHWEMERIRHIVRRIEQGWSPECENREAEESEWGVLKAGCVNRGLFIESEHKALPSGIEPRPDLEVGPGDLLMSRASGSRDLVGSVAVVPSCRPRLLLCDKVFRLHVVAGRVSRRFLALAMNSRVARWQIEAALSGGSGLANNIAQQVVKDLIVPLPAPIEQEAITAFLGRETARIDAMASKKERLIQLLEERRAALITRAVTKGIEPNVAMKDSGVEWLGEVPAHWEVVAARRLITRIEQGWSPVAEDRPAGPDEWAVIKLSAVSKGRFVSDEHKALPADVAPDRRYEIRDGDFLLTRANTPKRVGDVCVAQGVRRGLMLCDLVYRLRLASDQLAPSYLAYWFLSRAGRYQIEVDARGSSQSMVKVSQGHILAWAMVRPEADDQRAIAAFLDRETAKIDGLVAKVREGIDRLKKLRTALISAAVTGKIDVREESA